MKLKMGKMPSQHMSLDRAYTVCVLDRGITLAEKLDVAFVRGSAWH